MRNNHVRISGEIHVIDPRREYRIGTPNVLDLAGTAVALMVAEYGTAIAASMIADIVRGYHLDYRGVAFEDRPARIGEPDISKSGQGTHSLG